MKHRCACGASIHPVAELDDTGVVLSRFVYVTRAHVPDLMLKGTKVYRLITDHLGSVRLVVDVDAGTVAQRIDYDAWGKVTGDNSPGFQPFGFAGGLHDPVTKLVHFGAREYDPVTGRWTRADPILFQGGDANLYAYALTDPVNRTDTNGLDVCAYASTQGVGHQWIELGSGDTKRSYGFWPASEWPFGPGVVTSPDVREGENAPRSCVKTTLAQEATLEAWILGNYPVNQSSSWYYFGIHDCRDFVGGALDQLDIIQGKAPGWNPGDWPLLPPWFLLL